MSGRRGRAKIIEVDGDAEDKTKLFSAIREAVGDGGNLRQLVSRIEVDIFDLIETTLEKEVRDAVRRQFRASLAVDVKFRITNFYPAGFIWKLTRSSTEILSRREFFHNSIHRD